MGALLHNVHQQFVLLGAQLLDDIREQVLDVLGIRLARHDESVILDGGIGFGLGEVQDGAIISEEVHLVDSQLLGSHLLHDGLDGFIAASLL